MSFQSYLEENKAARMILGTLLVLASLFLLVKVFNEAKSSRYIGQPNSNQISVQGTAEVTAIPDVAEVTFTIQAEATTVAKAQEDVTKRASDILTYLKKQGIEDKDVKTINYSIYPRYDYQERIATICSPTYCPPPVPGKEVLRGYTVDHSIQVKIRKSESAGVVLAGLGELKVTNLSGLVFSVDNIEGIKAEARDKAIADAKVKAERLAKSLGVKLGRIVTYYEDQGYNPYYGRGGMMMQEKSFDTVAPTSVPIPAGENKIISNVTISYELR